MREIFWDSVGVFAGFGRGCAKTPDFDIERKSRFARTICILFAVLRKR